MKKVTIYTDGGCAPNPGRGGWGAVLLFGDDPPIELSGHAEESTNNRMELTAAIESLKALDQPCEVELHTDSTYVKQGITRWIDDWRARGWKTKSKEPVKNRTLWEELDRELTRHQVRWYWVKGHAGDRWNERADALASAAIGRDPLPLEERDAVHLFTAVSFSAKTEIGGFGVVLRYRDHERELADAERTTSANRMHILAGIVGLTALKRPMRIHVYTTSDYVKDGATRWIAGWKRRDWRTGDDQPVKHRDLWERLDAAMRKHRVMWHVVSRTASAPDGITRAKELSREATKQVGE